MAKTQSDCWFRRHVVYIKFVIAGGNLGTWIMGCVQCKDKEAAKLTEERDGSLNQSSGYRYGTDPTPQHYPSFGVTSIPNYNNFHAAGGQGLTVFGGVNSSSHTGTLRTRGGTGKPVSQPACGRAQLCSSES